MFHMYMAQQRQQQQQQQPSVKCPVCNYVHREELHQEHEPRQQRVQGGTRFQPQVQHKCSHDANMIFAKVECPICMDKVGPPAVSLSCGHVVCVDHFQRIGGRIGEAVTRAPGPANPSHRGLLDFMPGNVDLMIDSEEIVD